MFLFLQIRARPGEEADSRLCLPTVTSTPTLS